MAAFRLFAWLSCLAFAIAAGCTQSPASPVTRAALLARTDERLHRIVTHSSLGREITDDSLRVDLPAKADDWIEVRAGARARPLARFRLIGAAPSELEIESGVGIHRGALAGNDVLYAATPDLVEQLVLVEQSAHFAFGWELCSPGLQAKIAEGSLVLVDARGEERLRIPEPFALDAEGRRRTLSLRKQASRNDCHELDFELDTSGLTAPFLVDPALEVVTWQKKNVALGAAKPPARYEHGTVYDPVRKVTVVFGGRASEPEPMFGDTWEWDGVTWTQKFPPQSPSPRSGFGMTYSPLHGGVVLYGGQVGSTPVDVTANAEAWKYDGTNWTPLPAGPSPLIGLGLAFDSKRNVLVLYGGRTEFVGSESLAVWELGATSWKGPIQPTPNPGPLTYFAMTYDSVMERTLIFGGYISQMFFGGSDKTWAWDGTSWTEITNLGNGPTVRWDVAGDFDSKRKRSVFYGGSYVNGPYDQTWELSQANGWEQRATLTKPYAILASKPAYDANRDRLVLFGGFSYFARDDTFEYVHFGNTCSVADDCDGYTCVDGVCCSLESCGTCEACSAVTGKCEPVISADDPDSCTLGSTCDLQGNCLEKNGQGCSSKQECASGLCSNGVCCNSPCKATCESCGVTGSVGTCSLVLGSPVIGSCPGSGPCASSCDGKQPECSFAPDGSDCGTTCDGIELVTRACDGKGACVSAAPATCAQHYSCASADSCNTTCSDAADCAPGFFCFDSKCSDGKDVCIDEVTAQDPGGNQTHCAPYRCSDGKCDTTCNAAADCAPGSLCTAEQRCQPKPGSPEADDAGCGCRTTKGGTGHWGLLLIAGLLLFRRRKLWPAVLLLSAVSASASAQPRVRAEAIARADPWLSSVLAGEPATSKRTDVLDVRFGEKASDPIELRAGSLGSVLAKVHITTAGSPIEWQGAVGTYMHAPGVTGFVTRVGDVFEQLLLVEKPGTDSLHWRILLREDVRRVERESSGALLFVRANGDALLRLLPAYAIDALGRHVSIPSTVMTTPGGEVRVDFDLRVLGARFPILVDPALEAVLWKQAALSGTVPAERSDHAMAYDPVQQKVVLFGGEGSTYFGDTWIYDQSGWQKVSTTNDPPVRRSAGFARVENPAGLLLFGGWGGAYLSDTWRLDGTVWTQLSGPGPTARSSHSMCFASVLGAKTNRVVLMGGGASGPTNDDTWEWANGWTEASVLTTPPPLYGHTLTYDTHHQTVLTFGGSNGAIPTPNSFSSYDGVTWTKLSSTVTPERSWESFAFDPDRKLAVVFGGEDFDSYLKDTWEWDATNGIWTPRTIATIPPPRSGARMVYDQKRKRMVLFGGYNGLGLVGDTWEYRVVNGTCTTATECDGVDCVDGACCITSSCGTCSACSSTSGTCAPVLNAEDPDSCSGEHSCDSAGNCKLKSGSTCTTADECASNFCADGLCCNAPCQGACEACDLAGSPGECTLVTGDARHGTCPGTGTCGSTCNGNSANCSFAAVGAPCGASCENASLEAKSCDGSGVCKTESPLLCPNHFACLDGASCRSSCESDEHCQNGFVCRQSVCAVPGEVCLDPTTALDEAGQSHDCTPYACASGDCVTTCTSAAQCASGHVCTKSGKCATPGSEEASDEGCGCTTVGGRSPSAWWAFAALLVGSFMLTRVREGGAPPRRVPRGRHLARWQVPGRPGRGRGRLWSRLRGTSCPSRRPDRGQAAEAQSPARRRQA